jgi:hypothetical protein
VNITSVIVKFNIIFIASRCAPVIYAKQSNFSALMNGGEEAQSGSSIAFFTRPVRPFFFSRGTRARVILMLIMT